jgi:hypothetical protein
MITSIHFSSFTIQSTQSNFHFLKNLRSFLVSVTFGTMTRERLNTFMTFIMPFRTRKHWLVHNRIIIIAHFHPLKIRLQSSTSVFFVRARDESRRKMLLCSVIRFRFLFRSVLAIFFLRRRCGLTTFNRRFRCVQGYKDKHFLFR